MPSHLAKFSRCIAASVAITVLAFIPHSARAQQPTPGQFASLYNFGAATNDGTEPNSGLIAGTDGNFYGVTPRGGAYNEGTVYKITLAGVETVLYSFSGPDGNGPEGPLVLAPNGDFYGAAYGGGANGFGTLYEITPAGSLTTLFNFNSSGKNSTGGALGVIDPDAIVLTSSGVLYGLTGGSYGAAFKYDPSTNVLTSFKVFTGGEGGDGFAPNSPVLGPDGTLYFGALGGYYDDGSIFEVSPSGSFSTLYSFQNSPDDSQTQAAATTYGGRPDALILGSDGNLYGSTTDYYGSVFQLTTSGQLTRIYVFGQGSGAGPGSMIQTSDGNFYCIGNTDDYGDASVYEITPSGALTVLHDFNQVDSAGQLLEGGDGTLYGVTEEGGASSTGVSYDDGTVFSLAVAGLVGRPVVSLNYNELYGGTSQNVDVTIPTAAPSGGAVVNLSSSASAATVPSSVTIPAGQSTDSFSIATSPVPSSTTATITASYNGLSGTATLNVLPAALFSIIDSSSVLYGGTSTTDNAIELTSPAYADAVVMLKSLTPSVVTVPTSVTIKAGSSSIPFTVTAANTTSDQTGMISATYNGVTQSVSVPVQSNPDVPREITITPTYTQGNSSLTGDVYLAGQATAETKVTLNSSNPAVVQVPSSVTVENGYSSRAFEGSIGQVTSTQAVTVTATANGVSQSTQVTVIPPSTKVMSLTLTHTSLTGGAASTGTVTLSAAAPSGGTTVSLSGMTSYASFPSSVVVPAGATSASFTITTSQVSSAETVGITASLNATSQEVVLTVNPFGLKSVVLTSSSIQSGTATTGNRIYLNANAPSDVTVDLTTNAKGLVNVPSIVIIKAGYSSRTFTINVGTVQNTTETFIIASYNGVEQQIPLYVTPAPAAGSLKSVVLSPTSTQGGTTTSANRVYLVGDAPANTAVSLTSSNPSVASVPSSVTVQAGYSSHPFSIVTNTVTSSQTVTITATSGSVSQTTTLAVTP